MSCSHGHRSPKQALSFSDPDYTAEIWELICGDLGDRVLPIPTLNNLGLAAGTREFAEALNLG